LAENVFLHIFSVTKRFVHPQKFIKICHCISKYIRWKSNLLHKSHLKFLMKLLN